MPSSFPSARTQHELLHDLLMRTPAAIALLDGPAHVFSLVNRAYERLVGLNESELLGKSVSEVFPEVRAQGFDELLDRVYSTGEPYVGREVPLRLASRPEQMYLDFVYQPVTGTDGSVEGVFVHVSEVTEWVASRTRAEDNERQLRTLAESIPQLVWTCLPDGSCDYLSSQWVEYTGIPEQDQLGLRWLEVVMHPDDRDRTYAAWMAAVEDRQAYDIEYRLRRADGVYRWFKTRGTPARGASGQIIKWFGTCTDIEDQKRAEQLMLQQQKLESVGLLAGGIAHDFNNLLVGVLGNASLIQESLPENHALQPMVRGIVEAGEGAAHLTRQMLAYAGKGRVYLERIDLNALVQSIAALVDASFPKSVRLVLEPGADTPAIEADSGQMQQVILNLAINAAEAIGEENSGTVWIRTGRATVTKKYLSGHRFVSDAPREGVHACIEVEDTGGGIAPETLSRIFDPFFTTKFTGRGLGLAAVLGIVRAAHGAIEVTSTAGKGTLFRVLLPRTEVMQETVSRQPPRQVAEVTGGARVLVIDDEEVVRQTTRAALRRAGYSVVLAEDGRRGLEVFRKGAAEFSLVILDMSMPGMGGKEVLEKLRAMDDRVPVLIFSGFSEEQVHRHFAGLNISGFIQKPFTTHQIASAVHELLRISG